MSTVQLDAPVVQLTPAERAILGRYREPLGSSPADWNDTLQRW